MITYSTVLQTTAELTGDVFLRSILAPAGTVQINKVVAELPATGIKKLFSNDSRRKMVIATDKERKITALRIEKDEVAGYTLSREYVFDEKAHTLSIQSFIKNYVDEAVLPDMSHQTVPKSLYRMIDAGLISEDNILPISPKTLPLNREYIQILNSIIDGAESCSLPIICITPSIFRRYPVAVDKVTKQLTGLAHVLVLESRKEFHNNVFGKLNINSYRGSVGILYPGKKYLSEIDFTTIREGQRISQLLHAVLSYNTTHPLVDMSSFDQIHDTVLEEQVIQSKKACREAQMSQRIAELKHNQLLQHLDEETKRLNEAAMEKALNEAEEIIGEYEEDIKGLRNNLYEKSLFLQGLEVENQHLRGHLDQGKIPVIYFGQEKEFYLGEIQDLLLSTLEDALEVVPERSRKRDVILDILNSNNYRHITKDRNEQVKHLLKGYDGMSAKVRHDLEELGFLVEETNKHCKISYHGDNRYMVVFGSTPSDVRSGKNNAATLVRMAY